LKSSSDEPAIASGMDNGADGYPLWPWPLLTILGAASAVILPFLIWGNPSGHDFEFHLNSWMEVAQQWSRGTIFPRWASLAGYGYGEPRFIFYPSLSWILGATLGTLLPWKAVPGAYLCLALTLAGSAMFLLARRWLSARDAVFAAVLYAVNPYHLLIVYWRSAFAELLAAAVFPLLLLFVFRLGDEGKQQARAIAALGLLVAAAWLSDAPAGVMVNYSLILLLVAVALSQRSCRVLVYGLSALGLGLALAGFYLLPAWYEQRWVDIYQAVSEGVRPQDNFLFAQTRDPLHHQFNLLISLVALAQIVLIALAAIWWKRWRRQLPRLWWVLALWCGFAALLMFRFSGVAWSHLPKLEFVQFPWRWLLCMNVAFTLLLTTAWRWAVRGAVLLALLGLVVFAGRRILPPWWDTAADVAELHENIETGSGYEGVDEYVPVTADPEKVDRNARRATYEGSGNSRIHVFEWGPEEKLFSATVSAPGTMVLHLFNYPAWRAEVNGTPVAVQSQEGTGQTEVPVSAGNNQVRLVFSRTWDRTAGAWISFVGLMTLAACMISGRKPRVGLP